MKKRAQHVKDQLLRFITVGYYPPGHALPPIKSIAANYEVSHTTAQEAIHLLKADGVVEAVRGRGAS